MTGRHCSICSSPEASRRAAEMIGKGMGDVAIATALGVGRMSVGRHRIGHVLAPAQAIATAAARSRVAEAQRKEVVARAEAGTLNPVDYLAMAPIIDGLRRTDERLERVAADAEQEGQRIAVGALSGQQLRLAEIKAKLGGVGGYRTPTASATAGNGAPRFSVNILFSTGHRETITAVNNPPVVEAGEDDPEEQR